MKIVLPILAIILISIVTSVQASNVTVVIESDAVLECEGIKVTSPFKVSIDDKRLTVNGIEVNNIDRLRIKELIHYPRPSIEAAEYIDWLCNEATLLAYSMIDNHKIKEEIWLSVKEFFELNTRDSQNVSLIVDGEVLRLKYSSHSMGLIYMVPKERNRPEATPEQILLGQFNNLCDELKGGRNIKIKSGGYCSYPQKSTNAQEIKKQ